MKKGELKAVNEIDSDTCTIYADEFERLNSSQIDYLKGVGISKVCIYTGAMDGYIPLTGQGECEPIDHFSVNDNAGPIAIAVILLLIFVIILNIFI